MRREKDHAEGSKVQKQKYKEEEKDDKDEEQVKEDGEIGGRKIHIQSKTFSFLNNNYSPRLFGKIRGNVIRQTSTEKGKKNEIRKNNCWC